MGMRMGRYIAELRIEIAKKLLLETDWQVKRIAFESGHRNPDWFSEVFRAHTGMTPSVFRRKAGRLQPSASN
jgi:transcriptional regulator GlxA family with amidase domain